MFNGTHLDDDIVELAAGGNVHYVCTETERYAYGSHNPDVRYGFTSKKAMLAFIEANYDYYGEAGIFAALCAAGICYPL